MKAILIARVSTTEQKEAGNSLPSQEFRLEAYCSRNKFDVIKRFSIDESAYKDSRNDFDAVLDFVLSQEGKVAVCFDKVDRLSRNVFDKRVPVLYERALEGKLELHFPSDGQVINEHISATEKFQFGISLGLAKYYSDAISDNVKRAIEQKLRKGEWSGKAPIGYKNIDLIDGKKWIEPDVKRADLIIKLFEWYATDNYSMSMLRRKAFEEGLTNNTKTTKSLSRAQIGNILNNPFYHGVMRYKNVLYTHTYIPIISKDLFDRVQLIKQKKTRNPYKNKSLVYTYNGFMSCFECGCRISFYKQKDWVYGRCTNAKGICTSKPHLSESKIDLQIKPILEGLVLSDETISELVTELKSNHEAKNEYHNRVMTSLHSELSKLENRLENSYEDYLDRCITKEKYDTFKFKTEKKIAEIELKISKHIKANKNYYLAASTLLDVSRRAYELFETSQTKERNELLKYLFANCYLDGEKVVSTLKSPFAEILKANKTNNWLPIAEDVRRCFVDVQ